MDAPAPAAATPMQEDTNTLILEELRALGGRRSKVESNMRQHRRETGKQLVQAAHTTPPPLFTQ